MVEAMSVVKESTVTLGTVLDPVLDDGEEPPHAARINPDSARTGANLPNLIGTSMSPLTRHDPCCLLPENLSAPGRECAGEQALLRNPRRERPAAQEHVLHPHVCQECD